MAERDITSSAHFFKFFRSPRNDIHTWYLVSVRYTLVCFLCNLFFSVLYTSINCYDEYHTFLHMAPLFFRFNSIVWNLHIHGVCVTYSKEKLPALWYYERTLVANFDVAIIVLLLGIVCPIHRAMYYHYFPLIQISSTKKVAYISAATDHTFTEFHRSDFAPLNKN